MRSILWIGAALVVMAYAAYAFLTVDRRSDEIVIRSLIEDAGTAAGERDVGGVVGCLSKNYKDEAGNNYHKIRQFLAQAMRTELDYVVDARISGLRIDGDRATVEVGVKVTRGNSAEILYERHLTVGLTRESGRHALIVPVKVWRVTSVDNLGLERVIGVGF